MQPNLKKTNLYKNKIKSFLNKYPNYKKLTLNSNQSSERIVLKAYKNLQKRKVHT